MRQEAVEKVIRAFCSAVNDNEITYEESVGILSYLLVDFFEDVGRNVSVEARQGAVLQFSRALTRGMGARVLIVEGLGKRKPMTGAERAKRYRKRHRQEVNLRARERMRAFRKKAKAGETRK